MDMMLAPKCLHNDCGNCPGMCSWRNSSKSLRRLWCVWRDDVLDMPTGNVLPEASLARPKAVENKSAGRGKNLDNFISDADACRKGKAIQHG